MASDAYPFNTHGVGSDTGENHALYQVTITMSGYATTDGNAVAGKVNPYSFKDFSSLPTNKNDGLNSGLSRHQNLSNYIQDCPAIKT